MAVDSKELSFYKRVIEATPGGQSLSACLQCGSCGGSCPSGSDMDTSPRKLFAMVVADMQDEVLESNTPWYCVSCYYCTVRCPQQIPITDFMYTLKQMAIARGKYHKADHVDFSDSFVGYVERYGRSFEFGLATRYHLKHNPLKAVGKSVLGFRMLQKGRFSIRPESIRNKPQLDAILNKSKQIAARQEV